MSEELPEGWVVQRLGDLVSKIVDGSHNPPAKVEHGTPMLSARNIDGGRIVFTDYRRISDSAFRVEDARTKVRPGDVLLTIVGSIGRVAVVPPDSKAFCLQRSVAVISTHGLEPEFLARQLESPRIQDALEEAASGTAQRGVYLRTLAELPIRVAPFPEQRRIVEKVEALLEQVNRAKTRLDRVPLILKRFRQAVLTAACSGKLTEEWREGKRLSRVDDLLANVAVVRGRSEAASRRRRTVAPDADGPFQIPDTWRWSSLGTIADVVGGLTKGQKRRPGDRLRQVPYLRVANVQRGYLDLREIKNIEATDKEIEELRLMPGDLLFTEGGDRDKLGRGWIWSSEVAVCIHQNHIFRARLYDGGLEGKLVSWFSNVFGRDYFDAEASQTVNLASINITKLGALPVPIAPPEESAEIVARVERLLSIAATIERRIQAAMLRAEKLPGAILSEAFSGELVPTEAELARQEGRDYEPASVLLQRIAKERPAVPAGTRRRGPATGGRSPSRTAAL